jgi:tetratricopeptide (TPR) repeat protein
MYRKLMPRKIVLTVVLVFTFTFSSLPVRSQDLVPVSDITGGSSVFVFRGSPKAATKKFVTASRSDRSKTQRLDSAKKIIRQYVFLAKKAPRRARVAPVDPENLPSASRLKTMAAGDASKLFAGVGEYYIDREDSGNAVKFFREAYSLDSKNNVAKNGLSEALALTGNELLVKDNSTDAKGYFDEALKYNPNNSVAYYGLGEVFSEGENNSEAIANYEKALQNDSALTEIYVPLGILYYQNSEIAKADNLLTKAVSVNPDSSETQYFLGLVRYSQNRNDEALKAFQKAKTIDPQYAEAYYNTGQALSRLNRSSEALKEYQQATQLKPAYFDAWFALGSAYFDAENYPEAIKAFTQASKLKNDNVAAIANLGDAYRLSGNYNQAEAQYNIATSFIERDLTFSKAESADIYSKIGYVLAKQCEINMKKFVPCKWNTATRSLEKAVALSQSPVDYANLGWAYYNAGRTDLDDKKPDEGRGKLQKARDNLQKSVETNPQFVEGPLLNLAMTYSDLGDTKGAIQSLNKVLEREPKWVFAINELGIAYQRDNNYKEAANQFRRAIKQDDKFAPAYFNLGVAEFKNGNLGESKSAYQKLKSIGAKGLAARLEVETNGAVLR